MNQTDLVTKVADQMRDCKSIFVITGAGISADSGLPTYRGVGGLYNDTDTDDGIPIETALSGPVFRRTPEITWKYLGQIEASCRGATFNRGHQVLAEMERHFQRMAILTQNIDGFHTRAGSVNVIEIHGSMYRLRCTSCSHRETRECFDGMQIPPPCPACDQMMRPDVVLFEEQLPDDALRRFHEQLDTPMDMVISIGTSSHFPYIVAPVIEAKRTGIFTVEINPSETTLSDVVDAKLEMGAKDALEAIWKIVLAS